MTPAETLRKARALIEKPENWGKGCYATHHPYPDCQYCARGAVLYTDIGNGDVIYEAIRVLNQATGSTDCLVVWNDDERRTHADVLEAFDKAIAIAEAEAVGA